MFGFVPTLSSPATVRRSAHISARRSVVVAMSKDSIRDRIAIAVKDATSASEKFGKQSKEAATAWDVVEELSAELSHEKAIPESTNPLDAFCEANPEADECRTYDD